MGRSSKSKINFGGAAFGLVWLVGIAIGSYFMFQHEYTPGAQEPAPQQLPADLEKQFGASEKKLTLVMAVHPDCPCTSASIEQLDRFLALHEKDTRAIALFWTDRSGNPPSNSLENNSYWQRLQKLDAVSLMKDPEGKTAESLGSLVSGTVTAYDAEGKLVFQGGLTATRGHAGPSPALDALNAILAGKPIPEISTTMSFGCSLNDRS